MQKKKNIRPTLYKELEVELVTIWLGWALSFMKLQKL